MLGELLVGNFRCNKLLLQLVHFQLVQKNKHLISSQFIYSFNGISEQK